MRTLFPTEVEPRRGDLPTSRPGRRDRCSPAGRGRRSAGSGLLAVLAAATLLVAAPAAGQDAPELSFDAYGTLGVVHSSEDRADFVWNPSRPDGPGRSETVSAALDSRLGGQLTLRLTPELTAVAQAVVEQNHEDDYVPHLEWAYVQYAVTPEFSIRAGRRPLAMFLTSEHRKVSYANPWVRPPVELYGLSPVFAGEGVDVSYRLHLGDWTNRTRVSFGRAATSFPDPEDAFESNTAEAESTWGFENVLQRGGLTGRVAFSSGLLDVDAFDPFFDALRSFGPEGRELADRYEFDDAPFHFATVGAEYDPGPWFGMAELGWADFDSALGEKLAGYVTAGYRVGSFTPYVTWSRVEALSSTSAAGLPLDGLPPGTAETAAQLNAGLDMLLQVTPVQQNLAFGGRWDVATGLALKAQVDFVDMLEDSPGTFANEQPGFEPGGSARLLSFASVFVF